MFILKHSKYFLLIKRAKARCDPLEGFPKETTDVEKLMVLKQDNLRSFRPLKYDSLLRSFRISKFSSIYDSYISLIPEGTTLFQR